MIFLDLACDFKIVILCSGNLVIMLHDIYSSRTSHVYYIHVMTCIHGQTIHDLLFCYSSRCCQHIDLLFLHPIYTVTIFSYFCFCCLFLSCVHLLV